MASKRRSIHVEGLGHPGQPIPNASRIANLVWSGGLHGLSPNPTSMPEDEVAEAAQMFANLRAVVEASDGTVVSSRFEWCLTRASRRGSGGASPRRSARACPRRRGRMAQGR